MQGALTLNSPPPTAPYPPMTVVSQFGSTLAWQHPSPLGTYLVHLSPQQMSFYNWGFELVSFSFLGLCNFFSLSCFPFQPCTLKEDLCSLSFSTSVCLELYKMFPISAQPTIFTRSFFLLILTAFQSLKAILHVADHQSHSFIQQLFIEHLLISDAKPGS